MKGMRSRVRQGAKHSYGRRTGEDWPRAMAREGAIARNEFGGTDDGVSAVRAEFPMPERSRGGVGRDCAARSVRGRPRRADPRPAAAVSR